MDINVIDCDPIKANSYIPLDKALKKKKAIINIQNKDNECFKWCITRALNPNENHPERVDKDFRKKSEELIWDKIEFPVSLDQIKRFEKNNPDISVNVLGYKDKNKSVYPLHVSSACYISPQHVTCLLSMFRETKACNKFIINFKWGNQTLLFNKKFNKTTIFANI